MILITRYQGRPRKRAGYDQWRNVVTGEFGIWDEEGLVVVLGKGGDLMAEVPDELEVERVKNLILGFGWEIQKQEVFDDRLEVTIVKKREAAGVEASPGPV